MQTFAAIPMQLVGPIQIQFGSQTEQVSVPMATLETPLFASTDRGARLSMHTGGVAVSLLRNNMSRSIAIETDRADTTAEVCSQLSHRIPEIQSVVEKTSRFARFESLDSHQIGSILYLRLGLETGDASGHNMVTQAADALMNWILAEYPTVRYISVSGNFCTDKKVSAVNSLQGRGKYVIADSLISRQLCLRFLKTTPEKIVNCHIKKNLLGSIAAGSLCSANAHYANPLLALYLATGQDAANIVEGSQGITHAELRGEDLYFSVTLPNLIVGTVGNGKHVDFARENLAALGCLEDREPGKNAERLAMIMAAAVHCVELSLMAALTNPGELMRAHLHLERQKS